MTLAPITRSEDIDIALDRRRLAASGLEHLRDLCGTRWTDHNQHDPGITTLELLAYALTELGYRGSLPIEDLLASGPAVSTDDRAVARQFFGAREVLPNRPLTLLDYRKLLIDLAGVKNAWVIPHTERLYADVPRRELRVDDPGTPGTRAVLLGGLYEVLLEYMDDVVTPSQKDAVDASARAVLQSNRNLCEDFVAIHAVSQLDCSVCAEIELDAHAEITSVAARVLFELQETIAPSAPNYGLAELLARHHPNGQPYTADEVFDGPLLSHGFIDDADLLRCELQPEIHLSDLLGAIMVVDGVRAVRDILVNPLDAEGAPVPVADKWRIPVPPRTRPRLSQAHGRLVFYKRGLRVAGWSLADAPAPVLAKLAQMRAAARVKLETPRHDDLELPSGRRRDLAHYKSFQLEFPALYGLTDALSDLGTAGAQISAEEHLRRATILQFKAYLLLFDQLLANHVAQLRHAPGLLSVDPTRLRGLIEQFAGEAGPVPHTYAAQLVRSLPAYQHVYAPGLTDAALADTFETTSRALQRHNLFLDYLLARVGEDFAAYAAIMRSAFGGSDAQLAEAKCNFLCDCAGLSAARAVAYDKTQGSLDERWNTANISSFERRLARLLGVADSRLRDLATPSYAAHTEVYTTESSAFRFRVRHRASGALLLFNDTDFASRAEAEVGLGAAIERAKDPQAYRLRDGEAGHSFDIVDGAGNVLALSPRNYLDAQQREAATLALLDYLRAEYGGEGMYVIEGILLRLLDADDRVTICADPSCSDCADDDPFSYRLHVVLPAFAGRFRNLEFRRFVEDTIRREAPAHLLPKVCWVGQEDMLEVQQAYGAWRTLPDDADLATRRASTRALRDALGRTRNVYPARALVECTTAEEAPHFVLGRAALGTAPTT